MQNTFSRRDVLLGFGNALLLAGCGGGGGGGDDSAAAKPDASANLKTAMALMAAPHEAYPHAVPSTIGWWAAPSVGIGCYPSADKIWAGWKGPIDKYPGPWFATLPWFVIYRAADAKGVNLDTASNTGVVVGNIGLWFLSKSQQKWVAAAPVQHARWVGIYNEWPQNSVSGSPLVRTSSDGPLYRLPSGCLVHGGWGIMPIPIPNSDIAAMYASVEHRLERIDPALPDDRNLARLIVHCGVDYYPTVTTTSADLGGLVPGAGVGPFLYAQPGWRKSVFFAKADGVSPDWVLAAGDPV